MLKNQEKQENRIKELESKSEPLNNVSKTDLISMIKKSVFFPNSLKNFQLRTSSDLISIIL